MSLRDILEKLVTENVPVLLSARGKDWRAGDLLQSLSQPMLKRQAHMQPGMYIALINEGGYLGEVLYRLKPIT
jgi:hypothetical protein